MPRKLTLIAKVDSPGTINNGELTIRTVKNSINQQPWEKEYDIVVSDTQKSVTMFLTLNTFPGTSYTISLATQGADKPFFNFSEITDNNTFIRDITAPLPKP